MSQAQLCRASTANPTEKREKPGYAGYYDNEKDKKRLAQIFTPDSKKIKYSDSKSILRA